MQKNRKKFFIVIPIAMLLVLPLLVMLLWNYIVTDIFSIKAISYGQAFGLLVLCRLLFGRFGFGKGPRPPFARPFFKDKMMNLTDEERSRIRQEWRKRSGKKDDETE